MPKLIDIIQWVHKTINLMKNSLTQEEFIDWCVKVTQSIEVKQW